MRSSTRHQLKEDRFAKAITEQMHWTVEHRNSLIIAGIVIIVALAAGAFAWTKARERDDQASIAMGAALRVYNAPLRSATQPVPPDEQSFGTAKERSAAAQKEFQKIADQYPSTRHGRYALYLAGVSAMESGDSKKGEELLTKSGDTRDKDISALSKFALASLYVSQNRDADAVRMYKDVIQANAYAVPKTTAQLELASYYEPKNPAEAVKIYEEIQKSEEATRKANTPKPAKDQKPAPEVKTPLEQMAAAKIQQLKQAAR